MLDGPICHVLYCNMYLFTSRAGKTPFQFELPTSHKIKFRKQIQLHDAPPALASSEFEPKPRVTSGTGETNCFGNYYVEQSRFWLWAQSL